ncbi:hypothetical protein BH11MYX2_BH11MYX2_31930 [soil metagenome]
MGTDVTVTAGATIDTSTGIIRLANTQTLDVASRIVASGGAMIRVFTAHSFVFEGARVIGNYPFAAVAAGEIVLSGKLDASADGTSPGPGATLATSSCKGASTSYKDCQGNDCGFGTGGGGNGTAGGEGGTEFGPFAAAGNAVTSFAPFAGGCAGGDHIDQNGIAHAGGAGGGAVQLVSGTSITFRDSGFIDVGGGGGPYGHGGGAGGTVVLEAPTISLDGQTSGVTANGGAGGSCNTAGPDGGPALICAFAATPANCHSVGGNGGSVEFPARNAAQCAGTGGFCFVGFLIGGGGGGAVGKALFRTRTGAVAELNSPTIGVPVTNQSLVTQ